MPAAEIQCAQLAQCHLTDQTGPVRGAVDSAVVHTHQLSVPGEAHIALDSVGPLFEGKLIRRKGVLGPVRRRAPMRDDERMAFAPAVYTVGSPCMGLILTRLRRLGHDPMLPVPCPLVQPQRRNWCRVSAARPDGRHPAAPAPAGIPPPASAPRGDVLPVL
ncbi:Uncharacterised protein [Mycobacteroides abscessus subsp. abscessus]|nr:Uncharacterised protein [Mycobacteroides abscessus subsp. abscessus]